jgi:hypothetical protein
MGVGFSSATARSEERLSLSKPPLEKCFETAFRQARCLLDTGGEGWTFVYCQNPPLPAKA